MNTMQAFWRLAFYRLARRALGCAEGLPQGARRPAKAPPRPRYCAPPLPVWCAARFGTIALCSSRLVFCLIEPD
jgi:hypothetical protein